jgi:hypothetical protein
MRKIGEWFLDVWCEVGYFIVGVILVYLTAFVFAIGYNQLTGCTLSPFIMALYHLTLAFSCQGVFFIYTVLA